MWQGTGRDGTGTHAAVLAGPVDHRLVVGRVPFEHERAALQGHLLLPGQRSPEAGRALLLSGAAARGMRPVLLAAPV